MNINTITKSSGMLGLMLFQIFPVAIILFYWSNSKEWTTDAGWILDAEKGCKLYTNNNFQNRHFIWSGDCKEGFAHGSGEITLYEGQRAIYKLEGFLTMGKLEGHGKMLILKDGDFYEGAFKDSQLHGFGHYYNDDGDHYEGQFENGRETGFGTYWYEPDHPILKYTGMWKARRKHGAGTLFYRNGKQESGIFENDELVKRDSGTIQTAKYPKNILITNDDGVEDMDRLKCLAESFSSFAELIVIAVSDQNRSGTSNFMSIPKQQFVKAKCLSVDTSKQIFIYEVQGYPADCILLGASGIFREMGKTVDLVVSGINGGANAGAEWFGSGTVGAARTAAIAKIPAIAVSGINGENEEGENLEKICRWVANIVQSPIINEIQPFEYLTISIPDDIKSIKGTKVIERAITFDAPPFYLEAEHATPPEAGTEYTWKMRPADPSKVYEIPGEHDVFYYYQDYIVIVPMNVNENDSEALPRYQMLEAELPAFLY